jgi:hypothetical protein
MSEGKMGALPLSHISMDFTPKVNGKEEILVVVDRLTKICHFIPMPRPYIVQLVARSFIDNIIKLHGPPIPIVSDRDKIFTSKFGRKFLRQ